MLEISKLEFNPFGENTYLLIDSATKDAAVLDPGMFNAREEEAFDKAVADSGAKLTQIINTHMHLDHCFGANHVKQAYGAPLKANPGDARLGLTISEQMSKFGMRGARPVEIDVPLSDGDVISIGESRLQVIHVPGHSEGGIALYYKEGNVLFSGDSLFRGSVGRTDLLGGNHSQLIASINSKLLTLPADTIVLPGHGGPTTIGQERASNPFLQ